MAIRFKVPPGDVPPEIAARRMGLALDAFLAALPRLKDRGFPGADPDTGMFDLDAIDAWRRRRHGALFPAVETGARDAKDVVRSRLDALSGTRRHG